MKPVNGNSKKKIFVRQYAQKPHLERVSGTAASGNYSKTTGYFFQLRKCIVQNIQKF